jgi:Putative Ig domain
MHLRLPAAVRTAPYTTRLRADGLTPPYKWLLRDQLPPGLTIDSQGAITGTPLIAGRYSFSALAIDSSQPRRSVAVAFGLEVLDPVALDSILWSADFETGDTSQWYLPVGGTWGDFGGGEFDSGSAQSAVSHDNTHSGSSSLAMTIDTSAEESGTRMFRWREPRLYPELYYTVWYYFPRVYSVARYWNILQWKSKRPTGADDTFFNVVVGNRPDGSIFLYLYDWQRKKSYIQDIQNVPVGQWFRLQAFYRCTDSDTGQVTVWQDGGQLFNVENVSTRYADGDCEWSVNNYSDGLDPAPSMIYIDDAAISTQR